MNEDEFVSDVLDSLRGVDPLATLAALHGVKFSRARPLILLGADSRAVEFINAAGLEQDVIVCLPEVESEPPESE